MRLKTILITLVSLIVLGAIFFMVTGTPDTDSVNTDSESLATDPDTEAEATLAAIDSDTTAKRYEHPRYGFSFLKPEGYTVGSFVEGEGQMLIVQSADANVKNDFQIFISPLSEEIKLTPAFIKSDLPGTAVTSPKEILLDGKAPGIMFASNNPGFGGKSYEIWFTYAGHVYQITSYGDFSAGLQNIIGTWKFN